MYPSMSLKEKGDALNLIGDKEISLDEARPLGDSNVLVGRCR